MVHRFYPHNQLQISVPIDPGIVTDLPTAFSPLPMPAPPNLSIRGEGRYRLEWPHPREGDPTGSICEPEHINTTKISVFVLPKRSGPQPTNPFIHAFFAPFLSMPRVGWTGLGRRGIERKRGRVVEREVRACGMSHFVIAPLKEDDRLLNTALPLECLFAPSPSSQFAPEH